MPTAELKELVASIAIAQKETNRQMKELAEESAISREKTEKEISRLSNLFTTQWGKLVEALMDPRCMGLFQERGLKVTQAWTNHEYFVFEEGKKKRRVAEVDVMLVNGGEDIAVEVKTTCVPSDIDEHIERLEVIKEHRSVYRGGKKKLYGAVAALKYDAGADLYAKRKGFYVLKSMEGIVSIENEEGFTAKAF